MGAPAGATPKGALAEVPAFVAGTNGAGAGGANGAGANAGEAMPPTSVAAATPWPKDGDSAGPPIGAAGASRLNAGEAASIPSDAGATPRPKDGDSAGPPIGAAGASRLVVGGAAGPPRGAAGISRPGAGRAAGGGEPYGWTAGNPDGPLERRPLTDEARASFTISSSSGNFLSGSHSSNPSRHTSDSPSTAPTAAFSRMTEVRMGPSGTPAQPTYQSSVDVAPGRVAEDAGGSARALAKAPLNAPGGGGDGSGAATGAGANAGRLAAAAAPPPTRGADPMARGTAATGGRGTPIGRGGARAGRTAPGGGAPGLGGSRCSPASRPAATGLRGAPGREAGACSPAAPGAPSDMMAVLSSPSTGRSNIGPGCAGFDEEIGLGEDEDCGEPGSVGSLRATELSVTLALTWMRWPQRRHFMRTVLPATLSSPI